MDLNRYQYKGCLSEISITEAGDYKAVVEFPSRGGVVTGSGFGSEDEAEFAAEELINSWN